MSSMLEATSANLFYSIFYHILLHKQLGKPPDIVLLFYLRSRESPLDPELLVPKTREWALIRILDLIYAVRNFIYKDNFPNDPPRCDVNTSLGPFVVGAHYVNLVAELFRYCPWVSGSQAVVRNRRP